MEASGLSFGAMLTDMDSATRKKLGIKNGILLTEVFEGTAADEAGFRKGDILVSFEDNDLYFVSQFNMLLRQSEDEESVSIVYRRGNQEMKATLKIRKE